MKDLEIRKVAAYKFWGACSGKLQHVGKSVILLKVHSTTEITSTEPYDSIVTILYLWLTQLTSLSSKLVT